MSDEAFLRAMIADPEAEAPRLAYAAWLDERGDPRAPLLRADWDVPRLSRADWIASRGDLPAYLQAFPDLVDQVPVHEANRSWRDRVRALADQASQQWLTVVDTLGRPFRPLSFWNSSEPRSFHEGQLPFRERIGTRGPVVTFESAFRGDTAWQPGLAEDLTDLCHVVLPDCAYGAAGCPVHPFICPLGPSARPLTGMDILRALQVADFRSQHIRSLDTPSIPYPGYHPGTDNDEIHCDPHEQNLFAGPDVVDDEPHDGGPAASRAAHEALRRAVVDRRLWYVLVHSRASLPDDGFDRAPYVVMFAVGRSLRGERLIGVVSHRVCHNLCD